MVTLLVTQGKSGTGELEGGHSKPIRHTSLTFASRLLTLDQRQSHVGAQNCARTTASKSGRRGTLVHAGRGVSLSLKREVRRLSGNMISNAAPAQCNTSCSWETADSSCNPELITSFCPRSVCAEPVAILLLSVCLHVSACMSYCGLAFIVYACILCLCFCFACCGVMCLWVFVLHVLGMSWMAYSDWCYICYFVMLLTAVHVLQIALASNFVILILFFLYSVQFFRVTLTSV